MDSISLKAPAKVNLALDITGLTDNGYHILDMIVATIDIYDHITISKAIDQQIKIVSEGYKIPSGPENIMHKAVRSFFNFVRIPFSGVNIEIKKNIPSEAGLGGGSSDAAATLDALNKLFEAGLSKEELSSIGVKLGADVPLFFNRGIMRCRGIGEIITLLPAIEPFYLVIVKPPFGFSTAQIYKRFDNIQLQRRPNIDRMIQGIGSRDIKKMCENMYNVLEEAIENNEIEEIKEKMVFEGAIASSMTGSGSAVFGIFDDENMARAVADQLKNEYKEVFLSRPIF